MTLSRKQLQEIVEKEDPDARLVEGVVGKETDSIAATDFDTPDLDQLREKFLGETDARPAADTAEDDEDVAIVSVEKRTKTDPWDRSARPKAMVVSEKEGRVIGRQG